MLQGGRWEGGGMERSWSREGEGRREREEKGRIGKERGRIGWREGRKGVG